METATRRVDPVPGQPPALPPTARPAPRGAPDGQPESDDAPACAETFAELFAATYLRFHRRDGKRAEMTMASRAVLQHLSLTGPLTIGETARHLDRAQSVVSDIVTQLEGKGLLEREPDPSDRRRTLVWLTPEGMTLLARDRHVLSTELLTQAMATLTVEQRAELLDAVRTLLDTEPGRPAASPVPTHPRIPRKDP